MTAADYDARDNRNFDADINALKELEQQVAKLIDGYRDHASSYAGGSLQVRRALDEARIASGRQIGLVRSALYDAFRR